jgi:acetylornithine deacetylase/succinyl-diaminopimelate desuccinylase-like protein
LNDAARKKRHRLERLIALLVISVCAGVAFWVMRHSQGIEEDFSKQTGYVPKETRITSEVELLQQYIRIDTSNPPGNELPAARWLASILTAAGVQAEIIESAPNRANVYARIKGRRNGEGLLLLHHMDVIPATPQGWARPPFSGEIQLNQLYGRGAIDMKGTGICFLRAFLDVAKSGRVPERDVVFLAVADEEGGSGFGMRWLLENRPEVIAGVKYALNEGGITEMKQEKVTYYGIEIGTKQTVTVLLRANSREALQRARIALEPWFVSREPHRIMPEVRRFLAHLAPQRVEFSDELADIDRTIAEGQFWRLPVGYRELTQNGVWAEGVEAAQGGGFAMRALLLNLPDEIPDKRIEWLSAQVRPYGVRVAEILRKEGPVPVSPIDTPLYELLQREAKREFGGTPVGTEILNRWFNDSRFLRQRGIAAYGINPFPVDFFQADTIHGADERVRVDYFQQGVEFARRVVMTFAMGG